MSKKLFIYSAISGAGKTRAVAVRHPNAFVCSIDMHLYTETGEYIRTPERLTQARYRCIRDFEDALLIFKAPEIVIDNCNLSDLDIAIYHEHGKANGYEVMVVTLYCDPWVAFRRNIHGQTIERCKEMDTKLRRRNLPVGWMQEKYTWRNGSYSFPEQKAVA